MTDERRLRGFADCRGRVGCSWPGLIEAYRDRLPMAADWTAVTLKEGGTPLVPAPRLSEKTGCTVHIKVEGLNPTGSFKDRGMTMAVTEAVAKVWGADRVGIRLSPFGVANDSGEDDPMPLYSHLIGELSCWSQYQCPHRMSRGRGTRIRVLHQAMQDRQRESGCLTCSRLRGTHDIVARHDRRQGLRLNRGGCGVSGIRYRLQ